MNFCRKKVLIFQVVIVTNHNGNLLLREGLCLSNTKFWLHIQIPNGNICNEPVACKYETSHRIAIVV